MRICQPLRDIPRQAEEAVVIGSINGAASAGRARAFSYPVFDGITEFFCSLLNGIVDVAQLRQLLHDLQGLLATTDAEDALEADNTPNPGCQLHIIAVSAVVSLPRAEGRSYRQVCPSRH